MQRTNFDHLSCSVARTMNIIGEWWTPLILRDIFSGIHRFDVLRRHLGISRKVLTNRLNTLVENEIVERVLYQENPDRYEYRLTERGRDLFPVIVALMTWGDKWIFGAQEPPVQLVDRETNNVIQPLLISADTGQEIRYENVRMRLGSPAYKEEWQRLQNAIAESNS